MSFAAFLATKVAQLGAGDNAAGTRKVAALGGVTPRTIRLWMAGQGNPNDFTQAGVRATLEQANKGSKKKRS